MMGCGFGEARARVDTHEFIEWIAFNEIDPWTPDRDDARSGIIAATVANAAPFRKGRGYKATDFMPNFGKNRRQSDEDIAQRIGLFFQVYNQARTRGQVK